MDSPENQTPVEEDRNPHTMLQPEILLGFFLFHRRTIMGAILIAGIGYFLWPSSARNDKSRGQANSVLNEAVSTGEKSTEELLESVVNPSESWQAKSPPIAASILERQLKDVETLLSRELPASQIEYCQRVKIELLDLLYAIKKIGGLELTGIEEALAEIDRQYSGHENAMLAAKVNLACLRITMEKYRSGEVDADRVAAEIARRREKICRSSVALPEFVSLLVTANRVTFDEGEMKKINAQNLQYVGSINQELAKQMAVNLLRSDMDLPSLAVRVRQKLDGADREVAELFDALLEYSNFPVEAYSVAASAVRAYQIIGDEKRADFFLDRLREIEPKITIEQIREEVKRGVAMLEASAKEPAATGVVN